MHVEGYLVREPIARGGFAQVHMATSGTGKPVALKILDRIGEREEKRFAREFESLKRLSHDPNIVDVLDITRTDDGAACIVLEYMPGGSLDDLLQANPGGFSEADVVYIADRLLCALGEAHDHGIIHRDVKPSNVLLGNGAVKLGDFGIAKFTESSGTTSAAISTTVLYAAPEVLMDRGVSEKSDLYSLGSTVFTMLTGRPMHSSVAAALAAAAADKSADLELPGVSQQLVRWVQRIVAPDASDRFPSAEDARRSLADLVPAQPGPQLAQAMGAVATSAGFDGATQTVIVEKAPETSTIMYETRNADPTPKWPLRYAAAVVLILGAFGAGGWILFRPSDEAASDLVTVTDPLSATTELGTIPEPPPSETTLPASTSSSATTADAPSTAPATTRTTQARTTAAPDTDRDGIPDAKDICPGSSAGATIDDNGCSESQRDDDRDGVPNGIDLCKPTPEGGRVDLDGCTPDERDEDKDDYVLRVDCDDTNKAINPGAEEILDSLEDENCDGIKEVSCKPLPPHRVQPEDLQAWADKVELGDRNFGESRIIVTAEVISDWNDSRVGLRLEMRAEEDLTGSKKSIGSGISEQKVVFAPSDNFRIVSVEAAGVPLPRNGVADSLRTTDQNNRLEHTVPGTGSLVRDWRVIGDTENLDIGAKNGDDDANVIAKFHLIDVILEPTVGCTSIS